MRSAHNQPDLWLEFFGRHSDEYSIYLHSKIPSDVTQPIWREAIIPKYIHTAWGDISIVRATLALLDAAFQDPTNEHFILLSESCIPIKPFAIIKSEILGDPRGRMAWQHASDTVSKARANRMGVALNISQSHWIYHHQWITFSRPMASILLETDKTNDFEKVRVPDECYFGSVLSFLDFNFESGILPILSTYTDWDRPRPVRSGPYLYKDIDMADVEQLRSSGCLFARKFSPDSPIRRFGLHLPGSHSQSDCTNMQQYGILQ